MATRHRSRNEPTDDLPFLPLAEQTVSVDHEMARLTRKALTLTFDHTWFEPARHSFRVSSFPYCPVMDIYDRVNEPVMRETFGKAFYTNVGTTVHEKLMQHYMLHISEYGPSIYGFWKCRQSGVQTKKPWVLKVGRKKLHKRCSDPVCKNRGHCDIEYVELEFQFGEGSGHLDMLMFHKGRWLAWEFKTTGSFLFTAPLAVTERFYPDPKHRVQIQTYCALLKICYGITVDAYSIVYINRDKVELNNPAKATRPSSVNQERWGFKPFTYPWSMKKQRVFEARIVKAQTGRAAVLKAMAASAIKDQHLDAVLDARPCGSLQEYNGYMDAKFFGEKRCPYADNGRCFKPGALRRDLSKLIEEARTLAAIPVTKKIRQAEKTLKTQRSLEAKTAPSGLSVHPATATPVGRKQLW